MRHGRSGIRVSSMDRKGCDPHQSDISMGDSAPRWRRGERPKQRYRRRKALIQRIKSAAAGLKLPESDVAHRIELWRRARGWSIDRIQKMLLLCKDPSEPWGQSDRQLLNIR